MKQPPNLYESISHRCSVRKYAPEPASPADLDRLLQTEAASITGALVRFVGVDAHTMKAYLQGPLGKVFNAPGYIVMTAQDTKGYLLQTGYQGEHMILAATAMGYGSCWIGALFTEENLRWGLELDDDWRVVAITPLGRPSPKLTDRALGGVIRRGVGSHKRKAFSEIVFERKLGAPMPAFSGDLAHWNNILEAVRIAPSWTNYQPWRFIVSGPRIYACLVPPVKTGPMKIKLSQIKAGVDYRYVDMGIALAHFDIAREKMGIGGGWEIFSEQDEALKKELGLPADHLLVGCFSTE